MITKVGHTTTIPSMLSLELKGNAVQVMAYSTGVVSLSIQDLTADDCRVLIRALCKQKCVLEGQCKPEDEERIEAYVPAY
jgi:hypothetical protein